MDNKTSLMEFVKEVYRIWATERPGQLAAALAYYGMFAFAPVIFIALYAGATALAIPGTILTLAGGAVFGRGAGHGSGAFNMLTQPPGLVA